MILRKEVKVGKLTTAVMQVQLHTHRKEGIRAEHCYEYYTLHENEDSLFELKHRVVLVFENDRKRDLNRQPIGGYE